MKNIVVLIYILIGPMFLLAQEQPSTIEVSARAIYVDPSPEYKASISISSTYSSLPQEMVTLDKLKKEYEEALMQAGISWSDLKAHPNDFGYESMGYNNEGVLYEYRTNSVEKMKRFLKVKTLGVQLLDQSAIIYIGEKEAQGLSQRALDDAKSSATIIATAMGKQLGEIIKVVDSNNLRGQKIENFLSYNSAPGQYVYLVNVIFAIK